MSLTVEPALIALGGVIVGSFASGGVQLWITRQKNAHETTMAGRREEREDDIAKRIAAQERRAALRLVRDEFTFAWSLCMGMSAGMPAKSVIDPFAHRLASTWEGERRVLALELEPQDWNLVSGAARVAVVAFEMPSAETVSNAQDSLKTAIRTLERAAGGELEPVRGLD